MKLVNPKVEYLPQAKGLEGIYEQIEIAGRVCYKSEDKITEGSAKKFVERMIANKHYAMLEHGTVYMYFEINPSNAFSKFEYPLTGFTAHYNWSDVVRSITARYKLNNYSKVNTTISNDNSAIIKTYITTNLRVIIENDWQDDLQFICEPTEYHEKRYSFDIITSIGITRELIRHKLFSFANESTRFCNYSKDKFNNEITFIKPYWYEEIEDPGEIDPLFAVCSYANEIYDKLISEGFAPQQAREVLPLCTKSEIIMTGFKSDWNDFLDKRLRGTTGAPHPDMKIIAAEIEKQLNIIYEKQLN